MCLLLMKNHFFFLIITTTALAARMAGYIANAIPVGLLSPPLVVSEFAASVPPGAGKSGLPAELFEDSS